MGAVLPTGDTRISPCSHFILNLMISLSFGLILVLFAVYSVLMDSSPATRRSPMGTRFVHLFPHIPTPLYPAVIRRARRILIEVWGLCGLRLASMDRSRPLAPEVVDTRVGTTVRAAVGRIWSGWRVGSGEGPVGRQLGTPLVVISSDLPRRAHRRRLDEL